MQEPKLSAWLDGETGGRVAGLNPGRGLDASIATKVAVLRVASPPVALYPTMRLADKEHPPAKAATPSVGIFRTGSAIRVLLAV